MTTEHEEVLVDDDGNIISSEVEEVESEATGTETESEDDTPVKLSAEEEGLGEAEREAIRERRREEKKRRRANHREREETLRRELAARDELLRQQEERLAAIERRNQGSELAQLDAAINQSAQAYNHFKQQVKLATDAADGTAMAAAMENMQAARQRAEQLAKVKQAYQQRQQPAQPLDPRLVNHAKGWMDKNSWYDPAGRDIDSRVALTIDNALAEEGWNPTTAEYWEELGKRVAKYLPHRAKTGYNGGTRTKSVVAGSGRSSATGSGGGYVLSAERVKAIKDAGAWDDPKARADMIKRYREYDRQHGQGKED